MMVGVTQAATLNINATEDTTVIQTLPTTNAGTDKEIVVGTGGSGMFRFYLNFSNLTALHGKVITDAKINLTVNRSGAGGHADSIDMYRLFNTSWSENTTTWNDQPTENNTNHTSDLFVWNSTDYRTLNYSLFDVRQAIGYAAARNQTSIGFVFVRNTTTINLLTYFNSLNNGSAQVPRLEVTYEDVQNYTININASNQISHVFGMGLPYYFTNGTGDQSNITSALSEIAGDTVMTMLTWDNVEPGNATPADLATLNWSGFNFSNGREDELYNGEWHNYTFLEATQAAKNVSINTTLLIHVARPPSWIKNASTGTKWYPFEDSSTHENVYYFWKMVLKYAIENASYPANRIVIKPINEPYGNTNTSVGTYVERLDNYGEILRGAYDAVQEVNSSVRIIGLDDNDPALGLTEDLFARNATLAKYLTGGISFHNYLHGDIGYNAWDDDGSPRPNPYSREWELLYQNYLVPQCRALLVGNASLAANQCWLTENSDKYLVHNDGTGSGNIKIYNTTNDALWIAARLSALSQQDLNTTMFWVLQPVPNVNGYNVGDTTDLGYGFMESFQNNWTKYEAYNVSKIYDSHANGGNIVNISNTTLYDNYIFISAFSSNRKTDIFITNFRNTSSNISLNITNLSSATKIRRVYALQNATKVEDTRFSSTSFSYIVPANSSYLIELEGGALPDYSAGYIVAGTAGLSASLYLAYRRRRGRMMMFIPILLISRRRR